MTACQITPCDKEANTYVVLRTRDQTRELNLCGRHAGGWVESAAGWASTAMPYTMTIEFRPPA